MAKKQKELNGDIARLVRKIDLAESRLDALEAEWKTATRSLNSLVLDEQKARAEAGANLITVSIIDLATSPVR